MLCPSTFDPQSPVHLTSMIRSVLWQSSSYFVLPPLKSWANNVNSSMLCGKVPVCLKQMPHQDNFFKNPCRNETAIILTTQNNVLEHIWPSPESENTNNVSTSLTWLTLQYKVCPLQKWILFTCVCVVVHKLPVRLYLIVSDCLRKCMQPFIQTLISTFPTCRRLQ